MWKLSGRWGSLGTEPRRDRASGRNREPERSEW